MCLFQSADHVQRALDRHSRSVALFGISFAPSKFRVLIQGRVRVVPNLILHGGELTILGCFTCLSSCVLNDGGSAVEINMHISKAWGANAGLRRLGSGPDIT